MGQRSHVPPKDYRIVRADERSWSYSMSSRERRACTRWAHKVSAGEQICRCVIWSPGLATCRPAISRPVRPPGHEFVRGRREGGIRLSIRPGSHLWPRLSPWRQHGDCLFFPWEWTCSQYLSGLGSLRSLSPSLLSRHPGRSYIGDIRATHYVPSHSNAPSIAPAVLWRRHPFNSPRMPVSLSLLGSFGGSSQTGAV